MLGAEFSPGAHQFGSRPEIRGALFDHGGARFGQGGCGGGVGNHQLFSALVEAMFEHRGH